jgi:hypothetical protein
MIMKNIYIKIIGLLLCSVHAGLFFTGCNGMDDPYKEFVKDGPIVYMGKLSHDSLIVRAPGRNRLKFSWPAHYDSRVKYAEIYWANNLKMEKVPITYGQPTEHIIENIDEGSYIFSLYFCDNEGRKSVLTLLQGDVYGDIYESVLTNCKITGTSIEGKNLTLTFSQVSDDKAKGIDVFWKEGNTVRNVFVEYPGNSVTIEDYDGAPVSYRVAYKPEDNAIDFFYSEEAVYNKIPFAPGFVSCVNPHIYGNINQLFDGIEDDPNNYFSTLPNNRAGYIPLPHHIDFKLMYEVKNFSMRYVLRKNTTDWYPTSIELYVSSDGTNWESVKQFDDLPTENNAIFVSDEIRVNTPKSYIRVSTKSVNGNLGAVQFSEIEFYPRFD